jgi:hypothetical protein
MRPPRGQALKPCCGNLLVSPSQKMHLEWKTDHRLAVCPQSRTARLCMSPALSADLSYPSPRKLLTVAGELPSLPRTYSMQRVSNSIGDSGPLYDLDISIVPSVIGCCFVFYKPSPRVFPRSPRMVLWEGPMTTRSF